MKHGLSFFWQPGTYLSSSLSLFLCACLSLCLCRCLRLFLFPFEVYCAIAFTLSTRYFHGHNIKYANVMYVPHDLVCSPSNYIVLSCLVLSRVVLSCLVSWCLFLFCLVLPFVAMSCLVWSCLVVSCLVLSCGCLVLSWVCLVLSCGCLVPVWSCLAAMPFCTSNILVFRVCARYSNDPYGIGFAETLLRDAPEYVFCAFDHNGIITLEASIDPAVVVFLTL
jgi:hypothetical protein